jgi:hypothetical protein
MPNVCKQRSNAYREDKTGQAEYGYRAPSRMNQGRSVISQPHGEILPSGSGKHGAILRREGEWQISGWHLHGHD